MNNIKWNKNLYTNKKKKFNMNEEEVIKFKHLNRLVCKITEKELPSEVPGEYPLGSFVSCAAEGFIENMKKPERIDLGNKIWSIESKIPVDILTWKGWKNKGEVWIKTEPLKEVTIRKVKFKPSKKQEEVFNLIIE